MEKPLLVIRQLEDANKINYDLLLIADPSKERIDQYIFDSAVYTLEDEKEIIGCYVLFDVDQEVIEIKNIVIGEKQRGRGFGKVLLEHAIDKARSRGFKTIIIGTGNSSVGQLHLYQKVGFRISEIKTDYFTRNYGERIFENGIQCRDMIVLTKEL